jgi:hypothetical protein
VQTAHNQNYDKYSYVVIQRAIRTMDEPSDNWLSTVKEGSYSQQNVGEDPTELQNKKGVDPTPLDVLQQFNDLEALVDVVNIHLSDEEYKLARSWRSEARTDTTVVSSNTDVDALLNDDDIGPEDQKEALEAVAAAQVFNVGKKGKKPVVEDDLGETEVRRIKHPLLQTFLNKLVGKVNWTTYDPPLYRSEWSRIVRPALKKKGHVILDVCHSSGVMARHTVSKANAFAIPGFYKGLRKAEWGGLFPALGILNPIEDTESKALSPAEGHAPRLGRSRPSGLSLEAAGRRKERQHKLEMAEKRESKKQARLGRSDSTGDNASSSITALEDGSDLTALMDESRRDLEEALADPDIISRSVSSFDEEVADDYFKNQFKAFNAKDFGLTDDDADGDSDSERDEQSSRKTAKKQVATKQAAKFSDAKSIRDLRLARADTDKSVDFIQVTDPGPRRRAAPTRRKPGTPTPAAPEADSSNSNSD